MNKNSIISILIIIAIITLYFIFSVKEQIEEEKTVDELKTKVVQSKVEDKKIISVNTSTKKIEPTTIEPILSDLNYDVEFLLNQIKDNELSNISREDIATVISILQKKENNKVEYEAILNLYKSNISDDLKIFLASLLGEIATYEAAYTLTKILDLENSSSSIIYENTRAIENLIYNDKTGKINTDVSSALIKYWETSINKTYKAVITTSILKIGNIKESNTIINKLNKTLDEDEITYIGSAMKEIQNENITALVYEKYNNKDSSEALKHASIEALPYIANKTATLSLYDWSSKISNIEKVQEYFKIVKQRNPNAEMTVKNELYYNDVKFRSNDVKLTLENIFKKHTQ